MPDRSPTLLEAKPDLAELRKELERHEEVMKRLSQLTHKINNPLTALMGRAQMLQMFGSDPRVTKAADVIEQSAQRVADLIRELAQVVQEGSESYNQHLFDAEHPET